MKAKKLLSISVLGLIGLFSGMPALIAVEDVVIIGGGLAGLTTTYKLKQSGIKATLFEGSDRLGGRSFTYRDPARPDLGYVDFGGEFLDPDHETIRELCKEIQVPLFDLGAEYHTFTRDGKFLSAKTLLGEFEEAMSSEAFERALEGRYNKSWASLADDMSTNTDTRNALKLAFKIDEGFALSEKVNAETAGELFGFILPYLGMLSENDSLIYGGTGTSKIQGGNDTLINALSRSLDNDQIKLGHKLLSLEKNEGLYTMVFEKASGEVITIRAKKVVLAIPFPLFRSGDIYFDQSLGLPPIFTDSAEYPITYHNYTKIIIPLIEAPLKSLGIEFDSILGRDFDNGPTFWSSTYGKHKQSLTLFIREQEADEPNIGIPVTKDTIDRLIGYYEGLGFKKDPSVEPIYFSWKDNPFALGSYGGSFGNHPSVLDLRLQKFAEPIDGSLFFAGEYTHVEEGYLNSAVESGEIAAALILSESMPDIQEKDEL